MLPVCPAWISVSTLNLFSSINSGMFSFFLSFLVVLYIELGALLGKCSTSSITSPVFCFYFLVALGLWFRALCLLGKYYTTWAMPPAPFCFSYLWDRFPLFFLPSWPVTATLLISVHEYLGLQMWATMPSFSLFFRVVLVHFAWADLEHQSSCLYLRGCWDYRPVLLCSDLLFFFYMHN
jgi:hypothetical protein